MNTTAERVMKVLAEQLPVTPIEGLDEPITELDSLDFVELILALEEEFKIQIADEACEKIQTPTVRQLVELVDKASAA